MPLEVIGAGYGRTGTFTLKTALEMLGFGPCHHMVEILEHPELAPFWNRAAEGEKVDWEEIFGKYRATVDWPGCSFYAELAERYPDAKVILSSRDPERWYESMSQTILKTMSDDLKQGSDVRADNPMRFAGLLIAEKAFGRDFSRENVIAEFKRHEQEVRDTIAAERLLVFDARQGWEPLCEFLGVPVPDEEFPKTNALDEFMVHAAKANKLMEG